MMSRKRYVISRFFVFDKMKKQIYFSSLMSFSLNLPLIYFVRTFILRRRGWEQLLALLLPSLLSLHPVIGVSVPEENTFIKVIHPITHTVIHGRIRVISTEFI